MTSQIMINDLLRHYDSTSAVVQEAISRVLKSGWYVLGKENEAFEKEFSQFCGVEYCIGVANGTEAIELGLRALSARQESRVATVANAGYYTTTALNLIGATPVYVDIDRQTQLMDLNHLGRLVAQGEVDVVVITHLFGLLHDMEAVLQITQPAGIPVFEDCAQAHGARRGGRAAGSFGAASSFSFYPTKNLGALGDGGAVATQDAVIAARLRKLRQYGWEAKYRVSVKDARNSRLDEIQAAILRAKLPFLETWNRRRREIATLYSNNIRHPQVRCPPVYGEEYVGHLYVVTCDNRESLQQHLASAGIVTDIHYPVPDHMQSARKGLNDGLRLPVTEELADKILTLPCYPELGDDKVNHIITTINRW